MNKWAHFDVTPLLLKYDDLLFSLSFVIFLHLTMAASCSVQTSPTDVHDCVFLGKREPVPCTYKLINNVL